MKLSIKTDSIPLAAKLQKLWRYRIVLFVVFIAALSGYLVLQINSAINIAPSEEVEAAASSKSPRIDPALVQQLKSLQDNSVSVNALFNEARENPFQ